MIAFAFITNFGIAAAYWIFAQRYWQLSLKLYELKFGKKLLISILEQPVNIAMWILIFVHAATVQIRQPNWLALSSLAIVVLIDVTVWVIMVDAMYRIW